VKLARVGAGSAGSACQAVLKLAELGKVYVSVPGTLLVPTTTALMNSWNPVAAVPEPGGGTAAPTVNCSPAKNESGPNPTDEKTPSKEGSLTNPHPGESACDAAGACGAAVARASNRSRVKARKLCASQSRSSVVRRDGASKSVGVNPNQQNGCGVTPSGSRGSSSNSRPRLPLSVERTSWIHPSIAAYPLPAYVTSAVQTG